MAMPSSGSIGLHECITGIDCSSISCAVDGDNTGSKSLSTLSVTANKSAPHCMREFYGYTPTGNLCVGWVSSTPTEYEPSTSTKKDEGMEVFCTNLPAGDIFSPIYCYNADLSADACYCFITKRSNDGTWRREHSSTVSGNGTFTSYNITDSYTLDVRLIICDNATTKISCVGICMPDPPAVWGTGSGTIERYTYYCWSVDMNEPTLAVDPLSWEFLATPNTKIFEVEANATNSWSVSNLHTWINITNDTGTGDGSFGVKPDKNTSSEGRSGTIYVNSTEVDSIAVGISQVGSGV